MTTDNFPTSFPHFGSFSKSGERLSSKTKEAETLDLQSVSARTRSRSRTDMLLPTLVFETSASTNSAIRALELCKLKGCKSKHFSI